MRREHYGFLFGVLTALLMSVNAVFIRRAEAVPIATIIFIRFFFAFLCMAPAIAYKVVHIHVRSIKKHLIRGITGLIAMYCFFYSVHLLELVDAMTMLNTAPLFLPLIVLFWLKLIIPKMRVVAVLVGFVGLLVILHPGSSINPWGAIIGLVSGFFNAFSQLGIRQLSKQESTRTILTYYFLISTVISLGPMLYFWQPVQWSAVWLDLLLICITSVVFQYCLALSLAHAPATKVSAMNYLNVIFGSLLGWWIFQETPTIWSIVGGALIVLGGIISLFSKQESRPWGKRKNHQT